MFSELDFSLANKYKQISKMGLFFQSYARNHSDTISSETGKTCKQISKKLEEVRILMETLPADYQIPEAPKNRLMAKVYEIFSW